MTKKQKQERVIRWLTEGHLFSGGGYPYDHATHEGKLFVATLEGDLETKIETYDAADLVAWYDRAAKYLKGMDSEPSDWPEDSDMDFGDWSEAFMETAANGS